MKYETRKEHEDMLKAIIKAKEMNIDTVSRRLLEDGSTETIICMKDGSEKNIAATRNESPQMWNQRKNNSLLGRVGSSNSGNF